VKREGGEGRDRIAIFRQNVVPDFSRSGRKGEKFRKKKKAARDSGGKKRAYCCGGGGGGAWRVLDNSRGRGAGPYMAVNL